MPEFALLPNQFDFVTDDSRFAAYIGGIGSGKTYAGAVKVLQRLNKPGYGMIAAPTFPMLRDSTRRSMLQALDDAGVGYSLNKSENSIVTETKHEIICRSLDNPETLRGPNLQWVWVDEAALVSDMAWRIVKGRVREGKHPQAWITTTPKGRNWIWREWVADPDANHTIYKTKTQENKHLPDDFAESLGYTGIFAAQELGGEFVAFEGLIYPQFSREMVQPVDTEGWRTILGIDVGARNPTAILTIRRSGDGRTHIASEYYQRGMSSDEITDAIGASIADSHCDRAWIDPSAKAYISSLANRGHRAIKGANNDVTFGIGIVTTALADGFTIDPSCVHTIAEFESYRWADKDERDQPIKEHDHAMDALRYALVGDSRPKAPKVAAVAMPQTSTWG